MRPENVWDYPRPPRVERVAERLTIHLAGGVIADTRDAKRVLETSHPPVYYLPRESFSCEVVADARRSLCEWKGVAAYWSIRAGGDIAEACAWSYPDPMAAFELIRNHIAVYPQAMDACFVGDERVMPQPGSFYGGWVTTNVSGPFKGGPGTMNW